MISQLCCKKISMGKPPRQPALLTENAWRLSELTTTLTKMKANKSGDDIGIVVEFVQFASGIFYRICYTSTMLCSTRLNDCNSGDR